MKHEEIDAAIYKFLPGSDGHMHFRSIMFKFWEENDFDTRETADSVVWDSLKRLEKAGRIRIFSYVNTLLCFQKL